MADMLATVSRQPNRPQRHGSAPSVGAAWPKMRVADLASPGAIALVQLAIEDDAGTDSPPHSDHDQAVRPRSCAVRAFGDGRGLRVVGHDNGHAVTLGDHAAQGQIRPVEVDRPAHDAGARVDEARRADADAEDRVAAVASG